MAATALTPARLAFAPDGTPYSEAYGDVYHSSAGGLAQARQVFLAGNGLPERWHGRAHFVVLETGFGLGLNFLATWAAWRDDPGRSERLHFVSVEKHPFLRADLATLHARLPELAGLSAQLRAAWPPPLPGLHRLHFEGGRVTLTVAFGDALEVLPQLCLAADACYLDGFSPAKNPELWSGAVCAEIGRLAAPGARLATWSVAGGVRERLAAAGFELDKRPGFAAKREMLIGRRIGATDFPAPPTDRRVAVIGAGLAGSSIAERLAARRFEVSVIEGAPEPATGASGNPIGIIRPLPSLDDNRLSRVLRAGFLYAGRHLEALAAEGLPLAWRRCGVLHLARDARHEETQRRVVAEQQPPPEFLRFVERVDAARIAGWPVEAGGWWFPGGAWIAPPSLVRANLLRHGAAVRTIYGRTVARCERTGASWRLLDADGAPIAEAPQIVLAGGAQAPRLAGGRALPIWPGRGTVSLLPAAATPPLDVVVCRLGYVTPAHGGVRCAGATLAREDEPQPKLADHLENLARLDMILPGYARGLEAAHLVGRTSFRPMSPDRLPLAGPLPSVTGENDGLHVLGGFGARGLVWSALTAELLAAQMAGEPLPLEADLAEALAPGRFRQRLPKRRGAAPANEM